MWKLGNTPTIEDGALFYTQDINFEENGQIWHARVQVFADDAEEAERLGIIIVAALNRS